MCIALEDKGLKGFFVQMRWDLNPQLSSNVGVPLNGRAARQRGSVTSALFRHANKEAK